MFAGTVCESYHVSAHRGASGSCRGPRAATRDLVRPAAHVLHPPIDLFVCPLACPGPRQPGGTTTGPIVAIHHHGDSLAAFSHHLHAGRRGRLADGLRRGLLLRVARPGSGAERVQGETARRREHRGGCDSGVLLRWMVRMWKPVQVLLASRSHAPPLVQNPAVFR